MPKSREPGIRKLRMRLGPRGIGVRVANASGRLTGVRPLCSRSGLVLGLMFNGTRFLPSQTKPGSLRLKIPLMQDGRGTQSWRLIRHALNRFAYLD